MARSTSGFTITNEMGIGNILNQDPMLGPLAGNGGPTQTHELLPGNPAIDAGDPAIQFDVNVSEPASLPERRASRSGCKDNLLLAAALVAARLNRNEPLRPHVDDVAEAQNGDESAYDEWFATVGSSFFAEL